jgi:hypothetical protein
VSAARFNAFSGRSSYRLTMDSYGHALPDRMTAAANVMDETTG